MSSLCLLLIVSFNFVVLLYFSICFFFYFGDICIFVLLSLSFFSYVCFCFEDEPLKCKLWHGYLAESFKVCCQHYPGDYTIRSVQPETSLQPLTNIILWLFRPILFFENPQMLKCFKYCKNALEQIQLSLRMDQFD